MKYFVGIDGGLKGGIAVIGKRVRVYPMPIVTLPKGKMGKKSVYDKRELTKFFDKLIGWAKQPHNIHVILEQAQSFPGQGGVSNFSTGYCFGYMEAILTALKIPYETVHPKTWQKHFFKGKALPKTTKRSDKKKALKGLSYEVASKLFPSLEFKTPRGRLMDGLCDAVLMAEYGRRNNSTTGGE